MSEKKELNKEQLKKVAGGSEEGTGAIVDGSNQIALPYDGYSNTNTTDNDTFYGPAQ